MLEIFRVVIRWHPPESEFAFSSARVPSLTLNFGVARTRLGCDRSNWAMESSTLSLMKTVLPLISALILACTCISACMAAGALIPKPSASSLAETGAKEGGEHVAKGLMSPTPSPTPTPSAGQ